MSIGSLNSHTKYQSKVNWVIVFCMCDKGGTAVAGEGGVPWSVVDATELPPAGKVAKGTGEILREDHQAQPQLPLVGHHQPH